MKATHRFAALLAAIVLGLPGARSAPAPAAEPAPPVVLARSAEHRLASAAVGDDYVVQVRLPASYAKGAATYPVVCLLDADLLFELAAGTADLLAWTRETPEVILVGLGYGGTRRNWWDKRSRDFTPTPDRNKLWGEWPLAGGAARFREFLARELLPFLEERYRARPGDRTLVGLSFGGLFGACTLFAQPGLFQRYVLVAPALAWDGRRVWEYEADFRARHQALPAIVFTAVGDKDDAARIVGPWRDFNRLLESRHYEGLHWASLELVGETHISVAPAALSRGLRAVFSVPLPASPP